MKQRQDKGKASNESKRADEKIDISTADDVNVDEDNAVGSPKRGLTAEGPKKPKEEKHDKKG